MAVANAVHHAVSETFVVAVQAVIVCGANSLTAPLAATTGKGVIAGTVIIAASTIETGRFIWRLTAGTITAAIIAPLAVREKVRLALCRTSGLSSLAHRSALHAAVNRAIDCRRRCCWCWR